MIDYIEADFLDYAPKLPSASFDAVLCDPPYPGVRRSYGYWEEDEWLGTMRAVVAESRRLLKPSGSAVFVLQPTGKGLGSLRTWLWDFLSWLGREWNIVQDVYWWNVATIPSAWSNNGYLRSSVKYLAWAGEPDCYRNQEAVRWLLAELSARFAVAEHRAFRSYRPSGHSSNKMRFAETMMARNSASPMNLLPLANSNPATSGGANGHGAATPLELCAWLCRYLVPDGGSVLDPFAGSATFGVACCELGLSYVGTERDPAMAAIGRKVLGL